MTLQQTASRHEKPRIGVALADVIESGEELLADRVELSLLQMREKVGASLARSGFVVGGVVAATVAWALLNCALVDVLTVRLSRVWALTICGLLHAGIAMFLLAWARRRDPTAPTTGLEHRPLSRVSGDVA